MPDPGHGAMLCARYAGRRTGPATPDFKEIET